MKNTLTFLIGIVVIAVLLVYMVTFQVKYNEVAVRTTFDKATEPARDPATGELLRNADGTLQSPGDLIETPGLKFKAPWPIQKVYKYSTQVHLLEDRAEQITTRDEHTIIVRMYVAWRIDDPYAFFRSLRNEANAREKLNPLLRSLTSVVSQYNFDQMVNTDASRLKLAEIEERATEELRTKLAGIKPGYGIHVEQVGITRIILPEATTEKVFERMRKAREARAEQARAEGKSQAETTKARAESVQKRILAFAERRAQAIRDEGNREAAEFYRTFAEDEAFASYLREIETLRQILPNNTTFLLNANELDFLAPLNADAQRQRAAQTPTPLKPAATTADKE